jgi:hypothetical protein
MGVELLRRYQAYWGDRIDVKFVPYFLGGIMQGSGNRPPISVPGSPPCQSKLSVSKGIIYPEGFGTSEQVTWDGQVQAT